MAQMTPTVGDLKGNTSKIIRLIAEARTLGAALVAFPELAVSGYPPEDILFKPQFIQDCRSHLDEIVSASRDIAVVVGFPDDDGGMYNAAVVAWDGKLVDVYHKI